MFVNFCNLGGHILRLFNFAEIVKSYFHSVGIKHLLLYQYIQPVYTPFSLSDRSVLKNLQDETERYHGQAPNANEKHEKHYS